MRITENFKTVKEIHVCDLIEGIDFLLNAVPNHILREEGNFETVIETNLKTGKEKTYKMVTSLDRFNQYVLNLVDYERYAKVNLI